MRKPLMGLTLVATLLAIPAFSQQGLGSSRLQPLNGSGVHGEIVILDDGDNHLVFSGRATGMAPGVAYVSLLYDVGSEPGPPRETLSTLGACEPSPADDLTFPQMFIGGWVVDADGNGTLYADKTGAASYTPLGTFDTISIRFPAPGVENVQACGQVSAQISRFDN